MHSSAIPNSQRKNGIYLHPSLVRTRSSKIGDKKSQWASIPCEISLKRKRYIPKTTDKETNEM